jgi:serine/threonine-protein kinase RsbW
MQSSVVLQSTLEAIPSTLDGPLAIEASIAIRCEIDLSPGTASEPVTAAGPLILIDLDIATLRMLHNDAPCDHLACYNARFDQGLRTLDRKASREPMTETIELSIDSKIEFVDLVASITKSVTGKMGFEEDDASWIELAVHEAVINAIMHGNKNAADKQVDVRFVTEQNALTVYVRDHGEGFDPAQLPDPTNADNLLNPTGRGIFYMRTFMDEVEHSIHPEGGSVVRMKKAKQSN